MLDKQPQQALVNRQLVVNEAMLRSSFGWVLRLLATTGVMWALSCSSAGAEEPVLVAVNYDLPADYHRFLRGRDPLNVNFFGGPSARRDVVEMVLLMQALNLGGFKRPIEIHVEPSYLRILRGVADGQFISSGALMWKADIDMLEAAYFVSRPVVKEGEFRVGIYTGAKNRNRLNAMPHSKLKNLNVVTSAQWQSDVQTLKRLGFKNITYSPNWVNMVRMIGAERAEITLAPFQTTPDMSITVDDVTLYPIKDVTVAISGSRHWPISRKHPQGKDFYTALERGLNQLEVKGIIQQAYRECGFFHPDVAQWTLLKPTIDTQPSPVKHLPN
ncbi:MAG: hypothetical protein EOO52_05810 [Gammaproteobacteria bacterium]|nr:MAG: hypothetical protein EOO52_05810 [Gammaproteobacteria bacterium]